MAASIAKSKLLNLRNPALQILLRRPTAAASISPILAQSLNLPHPEKVTPNSSTLINQNFHISNLPLHSQLPMEAAFDYSGYYSAPSKDGDDYVDYDDMFDDVEGDVDMEDLSGSESDDDDEDRVEDDVEIRRPIRKWRFCLALMEMGNLVVVLRVFFYLMLSIHCFMHSGVFLFGREDIVLVGCLELEKTCELPISILIEI